MLTWQDTVKSDRQLEIYCKEHNIVAPYTENGKKYAQAEITWKARDVEIEAAHRSRIKEVVKWLKAHSY